MQLRFTLATLALAALAAGGARAEPAVTIFAPSSLGASLHRLAGRWQAAGHPAPHLTLRSSAELARSIQQGEAADIVLSADSKWMDFLVSRGLVAPGSRKDLLTDSLVLVAPSARPLRPVSLAGGIRLSTLLGPRGRLAIGDPANTPEGIYTRHRLMRLNAWNDVRTRLLPAEGSQAVLHLVENGRAAAGIVFGTDARGDAKVTVLGTFPADPADPIDYPIALVAKHGIAPEATAMLAFLEGNEARSVFAADGFGTP